MLDGALALLNSTAAPIHFTGTRIHTLTQTDFLSGACPFSALKIRYFGLQYTQCYILHGRQLKDTEV